MTHEERWKQLAYIYASSPVWKIKDEFIRHLREVAEEAKQQQPQQWVKCSDRMPTAQDLDAANALAWNTHPTPRTDAFVNDSVMRSKTEIIGFARTMETTLRNLLNSSVVISSTDDDVTICVTSESYEKAYEVLQESQQ